MEIASLIISIISLLLSIMSIIWLLANKLSTHQIQMVPVDSLITPKSEPIGDDFKDFDQMETDKTKEQVNISNYFPKFT